MTLAAIDGVTAMAVLLIGSFGIDRLARSILFLFSFIPAWARSFPDPAGLTDPGAAKVAANKQKGLYYLTASICVAIILFWVAKDVDLGLFKEMGFDLDNPFVDKMLTGLVWVAGAERVAKFLKLPGTPGDSDSSPQPVEITGTLILDEKSTAKLAKSNAGDTSRPATPTKPASKRSAK